MSVKQECLDGLDSLIEEGNRLNASYHMGDMGITESHLPETDFRSFATATYATVEWIAGSKSEYCRALPTITPDDSLRLPGYSNTKIPAMIGALTALRQAVEKGLLVSLESRLRANIHDDFLEQGKVLLDSGYHVAAMVLIGGVLEAHLQKPCIKNGLAWKGKGSLSTYNDMLHGTEYDKPTWRRIQAIGDVHNTAAHGQGANVSVADVRDAHTFVGRLIVDHPG